MKYDHTCIPRYAGLKQPVEELRAAKVWNRLAARYAQSPIADLPSYNLKLEMTRKYLSPDSDVLELACGTGGTAIKHAPYVNRVRAIDISSEMIGIAQDKLRKTELTNVEFETGDMDSVPIGGLPYDVVMAHSILHLAQDRDLILTRINALLKPGGIFVSSTVCLSDVWTTRLLAPVFSVLPFFGLPRVRAFSSQILREEVIGAGFEIYEDWQPGPDKALFLIAHKPS